MPFLVPLGLDDQVKVVLKRLARGIGPYERDFELRCACRNIDRGPLFLIGVELGFFVMEAHGGSGAVRAYRGLNVYPAKALIDAGDVASFGGGVLAGDRFRAVDQQGLD